MLRVTFGVSESPYLASRVLQQLSEDHQDELPRASSVAGKSFYVDDCITGAPTVQDTISLQQDLVKLMAKGKMNGDQIILM